MLTVRSGAFVASFHDRLLAQAWLSRNLATSQPSSYDDDFAGIKEGIHKLVELLERANGMSCARSQTCRRDKPGAGLRNACAQDPAASFYNDERPLCSNDSLCQPDLQCRSVVANGTTPATKNFDEKIVQGPAQQSVVRSAELLDCDIGTSYDLNQTCGSDKPGAGLRNTCAQHSAASFYDDERFSCSTDAVCQPDLLCRSVVGMGTTPATENVDACLVGK